MGLSWSRGYSQISESRERNCDPWCEPGRGRFQLQLRKHFSRVRASRAGAGCLPGREQPVWAGADKACSIWAVWLGSPKLLQLEMLRDGNVSGVTG